MNFFLKTLRNQKGAMFGLDARIALVIFSGLTVIAGVTLSAKISTITGSALVDEVKKTGLAIEGIHLDLKADLFKNLDNANESTAFEALYNEEVLNPGMPRSRWLGPYVDYRTNMHPSYGEMFVHKRGESHNETCRAGDICYLWLVMNKVPHETLLHANEAYDGRNETLADSRGRIQWQQGEAEDYSILWYRVGRSL